MVEYPIEHGFTVVKGIFGDRKNVSKSVAFGCKACENTFLQPIYFRKSVASKKATDFVDPGFNFGSDTSY